MASNGDRPNNKRTALAADLPLMMYGFGDDLQPEAKSVEIVEDMVVEYLRDVLKSGMERAEWQGLSSMDDLCIMMSVSHDRKRFSRLQNLIKANEAIKVVKEDGKKQVEIHVQSEVKSKSDE